MKTKYLKYLTCSLGVAIALSSCSDSFLDKEPDERVELKTVSQVVSFLSSGYSKGNYGWICELSSDNIIDNNAPHKPISDDTKKDEIYYNLPYYDRTDEEIFSFEQGRSSQSQDTPSYVWQTTYLAIATANQALKSLDEIIAKNGGQETDESRAARGEALLIRAYYHFVLVNVFSQAYKNPEASKMDIGIPYITEPETTVSPQYDRGNVAEVYDKIQKDLEEGLSLISDINYQKPKWHFNVNAAHAFAARFYLFKRDYEKVIEHADAVLGAGDGSTNDMLMTYDGFKECTSMDDYANVWQDPDSKNNLMLVSTMSVMMRHGMSGYRFTWSGQPLTETIWYVGPTWGWTIMPTAMVGGYAFSSYSNSEYGFYPAKVGEQFEYTDKVSGIGYPHIVRREFTASELILERAEAKLLGRHDKAGFVADMAAYVKSIQTFDEESQTHYSANSGLKDLTDELIQRYFSNPSNPNCFENWNFTQNMSSDFVIPEDLTPYMNCLNLYRRFETLYEGLRFFDLKRFGIEYSHTVGREGKVITLKWNDQRRAIEVPQEVIAAGLQSSWNNTNNLTQGTASGYMKKIEK